MQAIVPFLRRVVSLFKSSFLVIFVKKALKFIKEIPDVYEDNAPLAVPATLVTVIIIFIFIFLMIAG